jgi:predicted nucleic acid-binding protein
MRQVFADTSFWIALLNPRDELHAKAVSVSQGLASTRIVTSEMVLTEMLNGFSDGGPQLRKAAAKAVDALGSSRDVMIVPQTSEQFDGALRRYEQSGDKSWSLTDCASFRTMEQEKLQAALTHDRHFEQAGFEALLR